MSEISMEDKIADELRIDDTNLPSELQRQASRFFYWATMKAKAAAKVRQQKAFLDTLKAMKSQAIRDAGGKATERALDDALNMDEDVKSGKKTLSEFIYQEDMLETATESMRQRHYALIELVKGKESERILTNEYEAMKKDFEKRERK